MGEALPRLRSRAKHTGHPPASKDAIRFHRRVQLPARVSNGKLGHTDQKGQVMTTRLDRITTNPEIMGGQPCIRGMRLTVRRVIEALMVYPNWDDLCAEYPELEADDIRQALEYATLSLDDKVISLETA